MGTTLSLRSFFSLTLAVSLLFSMTLSAAAISENGAARRQGANPDRAVVLLESPSTAAAVGSAHGAAADAHRASIAGERAAFKDWLTRNAPQARVLWEYDTVLNGLSVELRGASVNALRNAPGVSEVLTPTWMSPSMDTSLPLVGWPQATGSNPTVAGSSVGQDVLVGIIDTGIDQNHPFFEVNRANRDFYVNKGKCTYDYSDGTGPNFEEFTSCKVVVAKVFNADPSFTPQDIFGHGTHVAGTAAGNSGTASNTGPMSGVAPAAVLGNYNVFPGETGEASSDDIAVAVDQAVFDGMDVLNLSLGGTPAAGYDILDLALRDAADAGVISAVAAGNSGPGAQTIESPGWTPWVLTAGASTNPHFIGQKATSAAGTAGAAVGDFDAFPDPAITASFVWWDTIDGRGTGEACDTRGVTTNLIGKIALVKRGTCTFTTKVRAAESLGAIGTVVFNNVAGDPTAMAHDGTDPFPTIPAVMVGNAYGKALTAFTGGDLTVGGPISEQAGIADILAGFSSRGPAATPDGLIVKPDMVAPGVNVNSSIPCDESGCGFAFFQGTSMATPHLAGSAAALIWNRGWQVAFDSRDEQVKSLLVNNSLDGVVKDHVTGLELVKVTDEGSGRLELVGAFGEVFYADPVAFNVGVVGRRALSGVATVTLSGEFGTATASASVPTLSGVTAVVSAVDGEVTLTLTRAHGVRGDAEGVVTISNGSDGSIHLVYFARFG